MAKGGGKRLHTFYALPSFFLNACYSANQSKPEPYKSDVVYVWRLPTNCQ
jgi:hypothetical protein